MSSLSRSRKKTEASFGTRGNAHTLCELLRVWIVAPVTILLSLLSIFRGLARAQAVGSPVPNFVSGSANITLTDDTFTGRTTKIALTSPENTFELALIQDGFGKDTKYQYCWTEVHDTATGTNLAWRAPCDPERVDECSLVLTSDGDFRLDVSADGSPTYAAFLTGTGGDGVVAVRLTDQGDLLLVKADSSTAWNSSDNIQKKQKCKEAFVPSSSSRRNAVGFCLLTCSIIFSSYRAFVMI